MERMTPEQIRACREGMRLSQPAFGQRIGVGRTSIHHYENGRRHDTKQRVEISRTTDMACAAAWLGIDGYTAVLAAAERAHTHVDDCLSTLPSDTVEPWIVEAAVKELGQRGFTIGENRFAFPLLDTLALWSHITRWCSDFEVQPALHPVISTVVPAIAIVDFTDVREAAHFKLRWVGGRR